MWGFTLVELLIVVCIISVIAGISLPRFLKTFDNITLENYAKDIVYLMRFAHLRAISENIDYRFSFEKKTNRFFIEKKGGNIYKKVFDRYSNIKDFSGKIRVITNLNHIHFKANGQTQAFNITLTSDPNKSVLIFNECELFNAKIVKR